MTDLPHLASPYKREEKISDMPLTAKTVAYKREARKLSLAYLAPHALDVTLHRSLATSSEYLDDQLQMHAMILQISARLRHIIELGAPEHFEMGSVAGENVPE